MMRRGLQASEHRILLLIGDSLVTSVGVLFALWLWSVTAGEAFSGAFVSPRAYWFVIVPIWVVALRSAYGSRTALLVDRTVRTLVRAAATLLGLYLVVYFYAPREVLPRLMALYALTTVLVLTLGWRLAYIWVFTETTLKTRILVFGAGAAGRTVLRLMIDTGMEDVVVVGFIDDDRAKRGTTVEGIKVLGGHERVAQLVREHHVSEIILAATHDITDESLRVLITCQEQGVDLVRMATVFEDRHERVPVEYLEADWLITSFAEAVRVQDASRLAKRLSDLLGALASTVILVLISPVVAVAIWFESGGPIFYSQVRVGRGGTTFDVFKFRTMIRDAEGTGPARWTAPNDPRVTRVGRFLRRTRLDELPQAINVLRGEMSLVGPRPERPEFVEFLERQVPFYRTRLIVKPGVTGWAQVNHPYGDSVEDARAKLEYDLYYIKHRSILFDLRIVLRTVGTVISFQGT